MKKILFHICLIAAFLFSNTHADAQYTYNKLVWYDEFNQHSKLPDTTHWSYDKGNGCPQICGWGNNEAEYYTVGRPENVRLEQGNLVIEAIQEKMEGSSFTSGRVVSKNKGDWKYCRVEVRAKIPTGRGIWPAIWMLPTKWEYGAWPHSGEIDIMENVGYWPDSLFGTIHTNAYNGMKGTQKTKSIVVKDLSAQFHDYSIEWTPDNIVYYLDGIKYYSFENDHKGHDTWPFDKEFHVILNVAVGGNWGGKYGIDEKIFPQKMLVDYVRIYQ